MKKVGLISFFINENYGAVLQSLALQHTLKEFGLNAVFINYTPSIKIKSLKGRILNKAYSPIKNLLGYKTRRRKTHDFINKHITYTPKINSFEEMAESTNDFDAFIVGSDQVWNPRWLEFASEYYLLSFVKNKPKFSYAASFGRSNLPETYKSICKNELSTFSAVSIREKTGAGILKELDIANTVVLDPTLLLSIDKWHYFFDNKALIKNKYILCYVMTGDHKSASYIRKYAKKINKQLGGGHEIIVVGDKEYKKIMPSYHLITDAGPADFLNLIYNAEFIITNSFHGTCFSINFEKEFSVVLDRCNLRNNRIVDLLTELSANKVISYTDDNIEHTSIKTVDKATINKNLSNLRENSLRFITDNFL